MKDAIFRYRADTGHASQADILSGFAAWHDKSLAAVNWIKSRQGESVASIEVLDLISLAQATPVDTDRPISEDLIGAMLLIRLAPGGGYPVETHAHATETITALSGRFAILAGDKSYSVSQGQCCRIPPGLEHRWAPDSEAVVLVHFGTPTP